MIPIFSVVLSADPPCDPLLQASEKMSRPPKKAKHSPRRKGLRCLRFMIELFLRGSLLGQGSEVAAVGG